LGKFLDKLDHPVVFVFFLMLALAGATSIFYYFTKSMGLQGAASALKHP
jgi:hypothetical protein